MKTFARLFDALDATTKTTKKLELLVAYFDQVSDAEKLWTLALFSHRRPKRTISTTLLRQWAAELAGLQDWLFEDTYHVVGDLAEAIALMIPSVSQSDLIVTPAMPEWIAQMISLRNQTEAEKKVFVLQAWATLGRTECMVFNKLITGGFRIGVSQKLITKAISKHLGVSEQIIAHRLMGDWDPSVITWSELLIEGDAREDDSKPFPFYLAYALEDDFFDKEHPSDWIAEYKWDGIRGQFIYRNGQVYLWSRGEELVGAAFPELVDPEVLRNLPDFVLDGEILAWKDDKPMDFQFLQKRITRKTVTPKLQKEIPALFMGYDILEYDGQDVRSFHLDQRRAFWTHLGLDVLAPSRYRWSDAVEFSDWDTLTQIRSAAGDLGAEGLMLKRVQSHYGIGRKKGDWWKWKLAPRTVDAVMIYAQRGHGRRTNLFTDFTFAVWDGASLVPFTKAYSGLTDAEFVEISKYVRANTIERFGPVCSVTPNLVFEIAFEGIALSSRHKSGVALRFPRILRWRRDKSADQANTLSELKALL